MIKRHSNSSRNSARRDRARANRNRHVFETLEPRMMLTGNLPGELPTETDSCFAPVDQLAGAVTNVSAPFDQQVLTGDYDGSGTVDTADYIVWKTSFGSVTELAADGNLNGVIDLADYTIYVDNLGNTADQVATGIVLTNATEPSAGQSPTKPSSVCWQLGTNGGKAHVASTGNYYSLNDLIAAANTGGVPPYVSQWDWSTPGWGHTNPSDQDTFANFSLNELSIASSPTGYVPDYVQVSLTHAATDAPYTPLGQDGKPIKDAKTGQPLSFSDYAVLYKNTQLGNAKWGTSVPIDQDTIHSEVYDGAVDITAVASYFTAIPYNPTSKTYDYTTAFVLSAITASTQTASPSTGATKTLNFTEDISWNDSDFVSKLKKVGAYSPDWAVEMGNDQKTPYLVFYGPLADRQNHQPGLIEGDANNTMRFDASAEVIINISKDTTLDLPLTNSKMALSLKPFEKVKVGNQLFWQAIADATKGPEDYDLYKTISDSNPKLWSFGTYDQSALPGQPLPDYENISIRKVYKQIWDMTAPEGGWTDKQLGNWDVLYGQSSANSAKWIITGDVNSQITTANLAFENSSDYLTYPYNSNNIHTTSENNKDKGFIVTYDTFGGYAATINQFLRGQTLGIATDYPASAGKPAIRVTNVIVSYGTDRGISNVQLQSDYFPTLKQGTTTTRDAAPNKARVKVTNMKTVGNFTAQAEAMDMMADGSLVSNGLNQVADDGLNLQSSDTTYKDMTQFQGNAGVGIQLGKYGLFYATDLSGSKVSNVYIHRIAQVLKSKEENQEFYAVIGGVDRGGHNYKDLTVEGVYIPSLKGGADAGPPPHNGDTTGQGYGNTGVNQILRVFSIGTKGVGYWNPEPQTINGCKTGPDCYSSTWSNITLTNSDIFTDPFAHSILYAPNPAKNPNAMMMDHVSFWSPADWDGTPITSNGKHPDTDEFLKIFKHGDSSEYYTSYFPQQNTTPKYPPSYGPFPNNGAIEVTVDQHQKKTVSKNTSQNFDIYFVNTDRPTPSKITDIFAEEYQTTLSDLPNTITGDAGPNILRGTAEIDHIFGGGSADNLYGGGHDDKLSGGRGSDMLFGEAGDDFLSGGRESDSLIGGFGDDWLLGDQGDDFLDGSTGDDYLSGGTGSDQLAGGVGKDVFLLSAERGRDVVLDFVLGDDTILLDSSVRQFRMKNLNGDAYLFSGEKEFAVVLGMGGKLTRIGSILS